MEFGLLLKGLIIGFSASVAIGPIGIMVIQRTLNKGRLSGFVSGMGASIADTIYAIIAGFSLTYIITFLEEKQLLFQLLGGLVLLGLGLKIFYTNPALQLRRQRRKKTKLIEDFLSIFFLTISNPIAVFLFVAIFAGLGLLNEDANYFQTSMIVIGVLIGTTLWWFFLSSIISRFKSKFRLKSLWWLNKISGLIIFAFGLFAAIDFIIQSIKT
ncbi:LysE family translocator [Bacteroidota bacterium]